MPQQNTRSGGEHPRAESKAASDKPRRKAARRVPKQINAGAIRNPRPGRPVGSPSDDPVGPATDLADSVADLLAHHGSSKLVRDTQKGRIRIKPASNETFPDVGFPDDPLGQV